MKKTISAFLAVIALTACKNETTDKLKKTKDDISNITSILSNTKEAQEESARLKEVTPLSNEELKSWLLEKIGDLDRSGFKVGKTGYMNVASIEGTYKNGEGKRLKVEVIDGAGEMGSILMTGMGVASKMDIEEEDENKHLKTVTHNGIKAQQTYYKKRNDTKLQFIYDERFAVIINTKDIDPEGTWDLVGKLKLEDLNYVIPK